MCGQFGFSDSDPQRHAVRATGRGCRHGEVQRLLESQWGEGLRQRPSVARGGEGDDPNFAAAAAKCKDHLAGTSIEVATGGDAGQVSEEQLKAMLAYARCMRGHGVDMPDPDPNSGALAPKGANDFDEESDEFQTAHSACRSHLGDAEAAEGGAS